MSSNVPVTNDDRSWTYGEVASAPLPSSIEDHLLAALKALTATLDVVGVCEAVLGGVEQAFGATSSWIMLHDGDGTVLRTALFRGRGAEAYRDVEIPADCGIAGMVFTQGQIQFVADAARESGWFDPARVISSGLRSVLLLPLIAGTSRLGVLGVDSPRFSPEHPPTLGDVRQLEIFAAQAAVGLVNARLYQTSQQDRTRLRSLLRERRKLRREVVELRDEVRGAYSFGAIVGETAVMGRLLAELERVAGSDATVLLLGETGTGKELLARALHEQSSRSRRPFVPVNCAALPEALVESEMFGHERGAFTGAHTRTPGRFELAHRGTLFLDEIADLALSAQAKLLRVIQDGEVNRVGSTQPIRVDARLVVATHQDLAARVSEGSFREDLFYRLSVFPIRVPPLRDRAEDIPLLARHLALESARRMGRRITGIEQDAIDALTSYHWPGNVRELQSVMERAVILSTGGLVAADTIRLDRVPAAPPRGAGRGAGGARAAARGQKSVTLADTQRGAILRALRRCDGRVSGPRGAAVLLGVKPTTLHARMKKLGVRRRDAMVPELDPRGEL